MTTENQGTPSPQNFSQMLMRADAGDADAMHYLGCWYQQGLGVTSDFELAREWYERAATAGNALSMHNLGWVYQQGLGVTPNIARARQWYERAAVAGNAMSMDSLGWLYQQGLGVTLDYARAREWYERAASLGHAASMNRLGWMHQQGLGVDSDPIRAIEFYTQAIAAGDAMAMNNLGWVYQQGLGVTVNLDLAREWYERGMAAGNDAAMSSLGWLYQQGLGVTPDLDRAQELYEQAAAAGNAVAMNNLGLLYQQGRGGNSDFVQARGWYEKAIAKGNSLAMTIMGWLYQCGLGVTQDFTQARVWYERAVEAGDGMAMNNLGWLYQHGLGGVTLDLSQALIWYERSMAENNSIAMNNLGWLYQNGIGVTQDFVQAKRFYEQAAAMGYTPAINSLGWLYQNGLGVALDITQAQRYYEQAAMAGDAFAMCQLGWLYEDGLESDSIDLPKSRDWYNKAAEAGNVLAINRLGQIYLQGVGVNQDLIQVRSYWMKAACIGNPTKWVSLIELDYIRNTNAVGSEHNNSFLSDWQMWKDSNTHATTPLPVAPEWLDKYIAVEMNSKYSSNIEYAEFWRILALIRLFAQWQQAEHLIKTNTTLHHFTSFDVIEKLLHNPEGDKNNHSNNVLRCYHVSYMNDPSEGQRLLQYTESGEGPESEAVQGAKLLKKWFDNKTHGSYFHQLDNADTVSTLPASVFTVSFTQRADSLDLWRAYGRNGCGVSISLPIQGTDNLYLNQPPVMGGTFASVDKASSINTISKSSEQDAEARYYQVKYGNDEVADALIIFTPLLVRLDSILNNISDGRQYFDEIARKHITEALLHILYLFKDQAYASEKEVRAIAIHPLNHKAVQRDEQVPRRLYCELPGCYLFTKANTQITMGPRVEDANAMIWDTRHLLALHGYDNNVTVKRSDVKYR